MVQRWVNRPVARWLSGVLTSLILVGAVTGLGMFLEPRTGLVYLASLYVLAIMPVAVIWGSGLAVVTAVLSAAVFNYVLVPPRFAFNFSDDNLLGGAVFLVTAVVVGELANRLRRAATDAGRFGQEQSALRRIATLVARSAPPSEVFQAVTREVGLLCGADLARMERYEPDGSVIGVAAWTRVPGELALAVDKRFELAGPSIAGAVRQTGSASRVASFVGGTGAIAEEARGLGIRSSVGCPITVAGRLWGVFAASTKSNDPFPANTESQIVSFTELVATAVANAEGRERLRDLADHQAALRRIATRVARGVSPSEVFAAVAEELVRCLNVHNAEVFRYEDDGAVTVVASHAEPPAKSLAAGERLTLEGDNVPAMVLRTGQPARMDGHEDATGSLAVRIRGLGRRSQVGAPIVVGEHVWGVALLASSRPEPLQPDTEQRVCDFAELVATALANAATRAELIASRARIVAAADDARRRLERDLHDGAQQQLVALALRARLTQERVPAELVDVNTELSGLAFGLSEVSTELREISRGIHPAILSEGGLAPALKALGRRSTLAVGFDLGIEQRLPDSVEVAAYYVAAEALTNAAKHAHASEVTVGAQTSDGTLYLSIHDNGSGGADFRKGSGLIGLKDRVEALGGQMTVTSPPGSGTILDVTIPLATTADEPAALRRRAQR